MAPQLFYPKTKGIKSISVDKKQFDQAVQFYTNLFGMTEIEREENLVGLKGDFLDKMFS